MEVKTVREKEPDVVCTECGRGVSYDTIREANSEGCPERNGGDHAFMDAKRFDTSLGFDR